MEVIEYTKPLTCEMLQDIVASQLCLWGDKQLVVRPEVKREFELFAANEVLLCCMSDDEMQEYGGTLANLLDAVNIPPPASVVRVNSDIPPDFVVGFYTDDGFIEVINYSEIHKA